MKKIYLFGMICMAFIGMMSCSGNKQKQVQAFAEKFSGYVNANQLDSIKAVYPTANFDSISPLNIDTLLITTINGSYRVNFGGNKWIEAKENEDGSLSVENSRGIAAFPQDKYAIALNTGMLNDSIPDSKAVELLNDTTYFVWLNDKAKESYETILEVNCINSKNGAKDEGVNGKMEVQIKNNLPIDIDSKDYIINYTMYQRPMGEDPTGWKGTRTKTGRSIKAGETINMTISDYGVLSNPRAVLNMPVEEYIDKYYKPTGKEYQEYLDSKK